MKHERHTPAGATAASPLPQVARGRHLLVRRMVLLNATVLTLLMVSILLVSRHLITSHSEALERDAVARTMAVSESVLKLMIHELDRIVIDWAAWDDTYTFMADRNPNYIDSNLVPGTLRDMNIDFMAFVNTTGAVVCAIAYSAERDGLVSPPRDFLEALTTPALIPNAREPSDIAGLYGLQGVPYMIAVAPILTSEDVGPPRGALIMGRRVGESEARELGRIMKLNVAIRLAGRPIPVGGESATLIAGDGGGAIHVAIRNDRSIFASRIIHDIADNPLIQLSVNLPRSIYREGLFRMWTTTAWLSTIGIVAILAVTLLSSRMILGPLLEAFDRLAGAIGNAAHGTRDVTFDFEPRQDEFGRLAEAIQTMLHTVRTTQNESDAARHRLHDAEKMASLGVLVSTVAHQVNNPNNVVLLNAGILASWWEPLLALIDENVATADLRFGNRRFAEIREQTPELLKEIQQSAARISALVEDLKSIARSDRTMQPVAVDLNDAVTGVVAALRHRIRPLGNGFRLDLYDALPPVAAIPHRIEQVVLNLIENALDAITAPGQTVTVRTRAAGDGQQAQVVVADEGIGIEPERLSEITKPFVSTKLDRGGTGLGLAIAAMITREHAGTLQFESEPGHGTTATLTLPRWDRS